MCAHSIRIRHSRAFRTTIRSSPLQHRKDRIVVTQDVGDFPSMLREWAAAQRSHAGAIVVYGIDHSEFELIIRGVQRWVQLYPEPASWADLTVSVDRDFASG